MRTIRFTYLIFLRCTDRYLRIKLRTDVSIRRRDMLRKRNSKWQPLTTHFYF